jgi:hypothetical protein
MSDFLTNAQQFGVLVTTLGGVVAGFFRWKAKKKESTSMLYEQLEKLKLKVILQVSKEVEQATELSEKEKIIADFKIHCPDCWASFIEKTET